MDFKRAAHYKIQLSGVSILVQAMLDVQHSADYLTDLGDTKIIKLKYLALEHHIRYKP